MSPITTTNGQLVLVSPSGDCCCQELCCYDIQTQSVNTNINNQTDCLNTGGLWDYCPNSSGPNGGPGYGLGSCCKIGGDDNGQCVNATERLCLESCGIPSPGWNGYGGTGSCSMGVNSHNFSFIKKSNYFSCDSGAQTLNPTNDNFTFWNGGAPFGGAGFTNGLVTPGAPFETWPDGEPINPNENVCLFTLNFWDFNAGIAYAMNNNYVWGNAIQNMCGYYPPYGDPQNIPQYVKSCAGN